MVGDLVERIGLIGRSRTDVAAMLGKPDSRSETSEFYHMCPSSMDFYVLELRWDGDEVASARVRDT